MQFRLLGPVEVVTDGRPINVNGVKQRTLLAMLVLNSGRLVTSDELTERLWDGTPPRSPNALHQHVLQLRRLIGDQRIDTQPPGYRLTAAPADIDVFVFEQRLAAGRRALANGDAATAADELRRGLELWRGPALTGIASRARAGMAERLEEARRMAVEDRIDADLELGRHTSLVPELTELVTRYASRERLRYQLMLALYRCDRHSEALATYRRGRDTLREEYGLDPSPRLQRLERAILVHDPALALAS